MNSETTAVKIPSAPENDLLLPEIIKASLTGSPVEASVNLPVICALTDEKVTSNNDMIVYFIDNNN